MKLKFFGVLIFLALAQIAHSQCGSITVQSVTNYTPVAIDSMYEADGMRNGPNYAGATVFYPIAAATNRKSLVLVPGFLATQSSVIVWARYLAARGFVCMTIGTNSLTDSPALRAAALLDAMETLRQENYRVASPLYQQLDSNKMAVGGWSMGGGGAQLAAKADTRVKAVLAITPWLSTSTTAAELNHQAPIIIISGQSDAVAPPAQHADVHYNFTPTTTPKLLFEITGADHNIPLNPATGNGDVGNVAYAWLKLFMHNEQCYCHLINVDSLNQNNTASKYLTNLSCATVSISQASVTTGELRIFPNPTTGIFTINLPTAVTAAYTLYNVFGQKVNSGMVSSGESLNAKNLSTGTYFLEVNNAVSKLIKVE